MCMYVSIHIYMCVCVCVCVYDILRIRERIKKVNESRENRGFIYANV